MAEATEYLEELDQETTDDALDGATGGAAGDDDGDAPQWIIDPIPVDASRMPWDYKDPKTGKKKTKYPQKGRKVYVLPIESAELNLLLGEFQTAQNMIERGEGNAKMARAGLALATRTTRKIAHTLSSMVPDWDIIGWDGRLLDKPYKNAQVLLELPTDAMGWLSQVVGKASQGTLYEDDAKSRGKGSPRSTARSGTKRRRRSASSSP